MVPVMQQRKKHGVPRSRFFDVSNVFFILTKPIFFLYYLKTDEDEQQKPFEERLLGKE